VQTATTTSPISPDLEDLPLEHLEHEITQLAAHINAGTCRWLELVGEFDRRAGWGSWGCRSCAEWIAWRCAVAPRSAREHVRVARCLAELPEIRAGFARGELSYAKVRALTRVADPESESELLELARHATAAQLERIVRACRRVSAREADDAYAGRYLVWSWDADGSLEFRGRVPAEDGALMLRALEAARETLSERRREAGNEEGTDGGSGSAEPDRDAAQAGNGSAEPPLETARADYGSAEPPAVPRPNNADALVAMAESSLSPRSGDSRGRAGPERHQVVVHVDVETLSLDADGRCELEDGVALSPETARRMACDSSVVGMLESDGATLDVGRKTRKVPAAVRRALEARDGRCRFPGCERTRFLDAHHLRHWAQGGETRLDNLVQLCRHHHQLIHEGAFSAKPANGEGVTFRDRHGRVICLAPRPSAGSRAGLIGGNGAVGRAIEDDALLPGSGEKLDLGWAVDSVLRMRRRE